MAGWLAQTMQQGVERQSMFLDPNGVPYHESLSNLRHFMCYSEQLQREVGHTLLVTYLDREQAWLSFCWMMAVHALIWEMKGFQFEPGDLDILSWI